MKILFICNSLNTGGAERVCVDIANGLYNLGHEVMILTNCDNITYFPHSGIELISDVIKKGKTRLFYELKSIFQARKILKEKRPDIVVSILYLHATTFKIASLFSINCPIVVSDHNSFERPSIAPMHLQQRLYKFYLNYFYDHLTILTEADKCVLGNRFKNVTIMYNPLTFKPLYNLPQKEKIILAVGRIDAWICKGFDLLIVVWNHICKNYPDWRLRIVGSGSEKSFSYLHSLVDDDKNIDFIPYTIAIQEEFQKAEIFVLSSRYEGFGLVLTEAMSQGCACVACDYKGRQGEIITDGENGLLCSVESIEELSTKISLLIEDEVLRRKLQRNAFKSLDRFSIDNIAKKWERLLLEVVGKNS